MNDHDDEAEKTRKLKDDLQKAALSLIKHLDTHNFRIRIEGSMPAVYITLGEGRSSYSADSVICRGSQRAPLQLAPDLAPAPAHVAVKESAQRASFVAYFFKLKKAWVA